MIIACRCSEYILSSYWSQSSY